MHDSQKCHPPGCRPHFLDNPYYPDQTLKASKPKIFLMGFQIGKFGNCAGGFHAGMNIVQVIFQFELKMCISAYSFCINKYAVLLVQRLQMRGLLLG